MPSGRYKLTDKQIVEIRRLKMIDPDITQVELAAKFNTSQGNISKIFNRKHRTQKVDFKKGRIAIRGVDGHAEK